MAEPEAHPAPDDILSVISREVVVHGDIDAEEDLRIEGTVTGQVRSTGVVVIEASASIGGGVRGDRILIRGHVAGQVKANGAVVIESSGRLRGDCTAAAIRISEGAVFEGQSTVLKP